MKSMLYEVRYLEDKYFGDILSARSEKIARCLSYYTKEADMKEASRVEFSYRHWSGYEEPVHVWISRIGLDKFGDCLVEMCSSKDILDHYWPTPSDMDFIPYHMSVVKASCEFKEVLYRA